MDEDTTTMCALASLFGDEEGARLGSVVAADAHCLRAAAASPRAGPTRVLTRGFRQGRHSLGLGKTRTGGIMGALPVPADRRDADARLKRPRTGYSIEPSRLLAVQMRTTAAKARSAAQASGHAENAKRLPQPSDDRFAAAAPAALRRAFLENLRAAVVEAMAADAGVLAAVAEGAEAETGAVAAAAEPCCPPLRLPALAAALGVPCRVSVPPAEPAWVTAARAVVPADSLGPVEA